MDIARWRMLDWWGMDHLGGGLASCAFVHGLQRLRPTGLQLLNGPVHSHGLQLKFVDIGHNALQHVDPGIVGSLNLLR
jgi:hypothetical protein